MPPHSGPAVHSCWATWKLYWLVGV